MRTSVSVWPSVLDDVLAAGRASAAAAARRPAGRRRWRSPPRPRSRSAGSAHRRARAAARSAGWSASRPGRRGHRASRHALNRTSRRGPVVAAGRPGPARRAGRCTGASTCGVGSSAARRVRRRRARASGWSRPAATSPISRSAAVRNGPQVPGLDAVRRQRARPRGRRPGPASPKCPRGVGPQQPVGRQRGRRCLVEPGRARAARRRSAAATDARARSAAVGTSGSTSAGGHRRPRPAPSVGPAGCSPRSRASRASRITFSGQNRSRWAVRM